MPAPKKPNALKILHGARKHTINSREPKLSPAATCPAYLLPLAKREWRRIMAEFGDLGLVTSVDQSALAAYCQAFALWRQASDEVEQTGITVREPIISRYTGQVTGHRIKKNPALTVLQQERAAMLSAGRLFGFDPSSRNSLVVPDRAADADDPYSVNDISFDDQQEINVQ